MFSSITSVYGNGRQGNYAAANAFLDAFAGYRRALGLPGLTVNWGVFSDVGYVSTRKELGEFLARQGQYGLAPNQGFAAMESLMRHGVVQATISRTDWPVWAESNPVMGASPRFRSLVQARAAQEPEKARSSARVLDKLLERPESERREELSQHLRRRVAKILGASTERVEPNVPLTDMGMDSLMAVELMTVLKNDLTIDIPAVKLLQGVTLNQLAEKVLEHVAAAAPSEREPMTPRGGGSLDPPSPLDPLSVIDPPVADAGRVFRPAETIASAPQGIAEDRAPHSDASRKYSQLAYARWTPFQRFARFVVTGVIRGVADVTVEGAHHVPANGPVLIAANHVSMWDAPVLLNMTERRTVMFVAEELRRLPWIHWTLHKMWDAIYLRRGEGDTEAIERALGVLRGGGMLGLAPEGARSRGGLGRGLTGVAHLAFQSGAPIVPVAVFGQERIPTECRRLKRAKVVVRIGKPISTPHTDSSAHALRSLTDRVMLEIARMLPSEYRGAYGKAVEAEETHHLEIA
jgi:1-acyl-sn-glycerol-3-phosphate acyltransferase